MLNKKSPGLLAQHGRKTTTSSSWLPPGGPIQFDKKPPRHFGWRENGIITGQDEMRFEADPQRYLNDPRFMGRNPSGRSMAHATGDMGTCDRPMTEDMSLVMFPERF